MPLLADELESDRQFALRELARWLHGDGDGRQAGELHRNGENIGEIHRERIIGLLADLECRGWRDGREQDIDVFECLVEVAGDERADPLGFIVIRIVITGGEDEGAEDDAPFRFRAEAGAFLLEIDFV